MKNERDFVLKITYKIKTPEEEEVYQKAKGDLSHQAFIDQAVKRHIHELNKNHIDLGVVKEEKGVYKKLILSTQSTLNKQKIDNLMEIKTSIRIIRRSLKNKNSRKLSQLEFSILIGCSRQIVAEWEIGKRIPSKNSISDILRALKNHWLKNTDNQEINEAFLTLQNYIEFRF